MIKINGKIAQPSQWDKFGTFSITRRGLIESHEQSRDRWFEWDTTDAFLGWAKEEADAVGPNVTEVDDEELEQAKTAKRHYETAMNSTPILDQIGTDHPFDEAPSTHLPNFDLHPDAPKQTFYRNDSRTGHLALHQLNSGAAEADNAQRLARSSMTIYKNDDTDKVHAHTNVGDDLIHSVVDTSANKKDEEEEEEGKEAPKKKQKKKKGNTKTQKEKTERGFRTYGGYSTTDFQTTTTADPTMRGHGVGYADTIPAPTTEVVGLDGTTAPYDGHEGYKAKMSGGKVVKGGRIAKSKTSNDNPRCYYSEKDTKGGADLGAKVKNHQHEALTREHGGTYVQSNSVSTRSETLNNGMHVPDQVHYLRDVPDDTKPYAVFNSGEALTREAEAEWDSHVRDESTFPAPKVWDSDTSLGSLFPTQAMEAAPSTPFFFPDYYERTEEEVEDGRTLREEQVEEDGSRSLAFRQLESGNYDVGRIRGDAECRDPDPKAEDEEALL